MPGQEKEVGEQEVEHEEEQEAGVYILKYFWDSEDHTFSQILIMQIPLFLPIR